jgi:chaperonin cofactor prefoldin
MVGESGNDTREAAHLRRLIEVQPSCLMRVAVEDSRMLAINDAAQRLFEVEHLAQALGKSLTTRIAPAQHGSWNDFIGRVWAGTSGSCECELIGGSGGARTVVFSAISLPDHPDGIPSVLVGVQDRSTLARLTDTLAESDGNRERLEARHAAELTRLENLATEYEQNLRAQAEESTRALDELREQLQQAIAARQQLETQLAERDSLYRKMMAEHEADQTVVERVLAAAAVKRERARKELTDALVERDGLIEHARRLAPLVAAGRIGLQIARDLRTATSNVENRAAQLLAQCPQESDVRKEIEILRNDTSWANALASQILDAHAEAQKSTEIEPKVPDTLTDSDCPTLP